MNNNIKDNKNSNPETKQVDKQEEIKDFSSNHLPDTKKQKLPSLTRQPNQEANWKLKDEEEKKKQEEEELKKFPPVSYWKLQFSLNTFQDNLFFFLMVLGSMGMGLSIPLFSIYLGETMNEMADLEGDELVDEVKSLSLKLVYSGVGMLGGGFLTFFFAGVNCDNLTNKIREEYFKVLLKQEQGFYDSRNTHEYATKVQSQIKTIHSGLGIKVSITLYSFFNFVLSIITGLAFSWKLSLCICVVLPFMAIAVYYLIETMNRSSSAARVNFEEAGGIAEEVLYNIKTVASFSNLEYERKRFNDKVQECYNKEKFGGTLSSFFKGLTWLLMYGAFGIATGVGAKFIGDNQKDGDYDTLKPGDVMVVAFSIIIGSLSIGSALPSIKAISSACIASREFFYLRERKPNIDLSRSLDKPALHEIAGKIEFKNLIFSYPSNPERNILNNLSLVFEPGKRTAIVGESGSGKSTVVNLLERLYDPQQGEVLLDQRNIMSFDLQYYRSMIGYVPQEPVLMNTSLKENIIFGRKDVTDEEIEEAVKKSFLDDFVEKLPQGINTKVGLKGSKLSGGQKQRVAIARAILKKPKILILDEATSALDYKSEKIVQKALDKVSSSVTTVIIAHRLSTVRNADNIIVMSQGVINDMGKHDELMSREGIYYLLVKSQERAKENPEEVKEEQINEDEFPSNNEDQIRVNSNDQNYNTHSQFMAHSNDLKESKLEVKDPNNILIINKNKDGNINNKEFSSLKNKDASLKEPRKPEEGPEDNREQFQRIQKLSNDLENEDIPISERKKIHDELESIKDKQVENAKKALWPILMEIPSTLFLSTLFACIDGTVWPLFGFLLAEAMTKLSEKDPQKVIDEGAFIAGMFVILASVSAICSFLVGTYFTQIGEHVALRLRNKCYDKYLRLHMGFYDQNTNSPGALMTKLAQDTMNINGIALSMFAVLLQLLVTLVIGLIIGFIYSWQLGLICVGFIPFLIIGGVADVQMQSGSNKSNMIKEKDLGNLLSESLNSTKTIFCYNMEEKASEKYRDKIHEGEGVLSNHMISAFVLGFSWCIMFITYAVCFYVGAKLIADEDVNLSMEDMNRSVFTLTFACYGLGYLSMYLGDLEQGRKSMISLYSVLAFPSDIDPDEGKDKEENSKFIAEKESFVAKIEFLNVNFAYPTRLETPVFKNLSFVIEEGDHAAFVGFSGSGKSTIIQLILRFYDVQEGEILINGINIKDYDLVSLRKMMGLVMQEPALFKTNIFNNIHYGDQSASPEQVIESAEKAMIARLDEITPESTQEIPVSGGEKQRIAIARCILKNPRVLLLDEATSALDEKIEKEIQKSLDSLMEGRTSVIIAHKLSTVVNCNKIIFLENGEIKETGNHKELLNKKGRYYALFTSSQNK
mmetsp:Transcript_18779/g.19453  ORF Transcript_18779/g.19453 Transcript_18779/m.19453 type:complete len:1385 (-) Transcript_18779:57-4211(-)